MNNKIIFRSIVGFFFLILSFSSFSQASKGLKYLDKNKFNEAYQAFQAGLAKPGEAPIAHYGLALLYSTPTYPQYNIDTAYAEVIRAEQSYKKLDYKLKGKVSKKLSTSEMRKAKKQIAAKAYEKYEELNTLEGWNYFLNTYKKPGYKIAKNAQIQRNKMAFEEAKEKEGYEALGEVLLKYRKSMASKSPAIFKKVEGELLERYMKEKGWESYDEFAEAYPTHSFVKDSVYYELLYLDEATDYDGMFAMFAKYKKSSFSNVIGDFLASGLPSEGNMEQCERFVTLFPNHPDGKPVWERFYRLYRKKNPRYDDIIAFEKKYPDSPIQDIIQNDKNHFAEKRFENVMAKKDPRAMKQFINQFPNYPRVKEVEDIYFQSALTDLDGESLDQLLEFEKNNPSVIKQAKWSGMKARALDDYFDNIGNVDDRHDILKAIKEYPDHPKVREAWKAYYERYKDEVGDDEASLDEFLKRHTEFPYPELIVQDKKKIMNNVVDMAIEMGSWQDCTNLAVKYPTHSKNRNLWRKGLDLFLKDQPSYGRLQSFKRSYPDCPFMSEVDAAIEKVREKKKANTKVLDRRAKPKTGEGIFGLINTNYDEYVPVMTTDGKYLYFCRQVGTEKIYVSRFQDGQFQEATPIEELNVKATNVSPLTISSDGNTMLVFLSGRIAQTTKTKSGWSDPVELPATFNAENWNSDPTYSSDGKVIIFTRQPFLGIQDLYISHLQEDGTWSDAVRMPEPVNTRDNNERSPFLHPNMRTLYFSSERPGGYGKLDVYVTERIGDGWDKWSEPKNLGESVNSSDYDWGFRVTTDGLNGYYNKQRLGESDIYLIPLAKEFQAESVTSISGFVKTRAGKGIGADIVWTQLNTGKEVQKTTSNPENGYFFAILPEKGLYGYTIEKKGYFPLSGNIEVTEESVNFVLDKDMVLTTIAESKAENVSLPLNNLFFDTGKYSIKTTSHTELKRLKDWIDENDLSIVIIGHTDNVGAASSNMLLSQNRAKAVKDYLVSIGADPAKILTKGMGETAPIETNTTSSGRQANRRVEIKLK